MKIIQNVQNRGRFFEEMSATNYHSFEFDYTVAAV